MSVRVICGSNSEKGGLRDDSETGYDLWFGDDGTDKKTGGQHGGGKAENCNSQRADAIFLYNP